MKYSINKLSGKLCSNNQKASQTISNSNYNYMLSNFVKIVLDFSITKDNAMHTTLADGTKKYRFSGLVTNDSCEQVIISNKTSSIIKLTIYDGDVSLSLN